MFCFTAAMFMVNKVLCEKIESYFETESSDAQRINLTFVPAVLLQFSSATFLPNII